MRRVVHLDGLACPRCGGRLRVIATVQDPLAVQAILAHLARSNTPAPPAPAALTSPVPQRLSRLAPLTLGGAPGHSAAPPDTRRRPRPAATPPPAPCPPP
jgi:hypothetical protein